MAVKPLLIALVGAHQETDRLYEYLKEHLPRSTSVKCVAIGDPFECYAEMKVGLPHGWLDPASRLLMRWSLFYQFNLTVARPALSNSHAVVLVRRFGFDLVSGSFSHQEQGELPKLLKMHEELVQHGVIDLNVPPPIYMFTQELSDRERHLQEKYFQLPGQQFETINCCIPLKAKAEKVAEIVRLQLKSARRAAAA